MILNFNKVEDNYYKSIETLNLCYLDIMYYKDTSRFTEYEKKHNITRLKNTPQYPFYLTIKLLVKPAKQSSLKIINELEQLKTHLTEEYYCIFLLAKGCYYRLSEDFEKSIISFTEGLDYKSNKFIQSMLYYNRANSHLLLNQYYAASNDLETAKDLFEKCLSIRRVISCMNSKAILLILNNNNLDAIDILKNGLNIANYLKEPYLNFEMTNNLVLALIGCEQFNEGLLHTKALLEFEKKTSSSFFYEIYCTFRLDQINECQQLISHFLHENHLFNKNDYICQIIILIDYIINDENSKVIEKQLLKCYKMVQLSSDHVIKVLILKLLTDFYKKQKSYKKSLFYSEELRILTSQKL